MFVSVFIVWCHFYDDLWSEPSLQVSESIPESEPCDGYLLLASSIRRSSSHRNNELKQATSSHHREVGRVYDTRSYVHFRQIRFRVQVRCHLLDWLFWSASCSVLLYVDELERGCLFRRNTLVGVTALGDRGSWSYPFNLCPLKCTRPPSSREGVQLSVLVPLFCGCQYWYNYL